MIEILVELLEKDSFIDEYIVEVTKKLSTEHFFIRTKKDMSRFVDVEKYLVKLYHKVDNEYMYYSVSFSPDEERKEIINKLEEAKKAMVYVKIPIFKLPKPIEKNFASEVIDESLIYDNIADILSENKSNINACEIFDVEESIRIITSRGTDVSFNGKRMFLELVAMDETNMYEFVTNIDMIGDFDKDILDRRIKSACNIAKLRKDALSNIQISNLPLVIEGEAISIMFKAIFDRCNLANIYDKSSNYEVGKMITDNINGDCINMKVGVFSGECPFDKEGIIKNERILIDNHKLVDVFGEKKYCDYLSYDQKGFYEGYRVKGGSLKDEDLLNKPHIRVLAFSDFQTDRISGAFGSEIRLGDYFDGEKHNYFEGMAISGDLDKSLENIYLSNEVLRYNNNIIPKCCLINDFNI